MSRLQQSILRLPQTYGLLVGVGLGYAGLLVWQGTRLIVWIAGAAIALVAIAAWFWVLRQVPLPSAKPGVSPDHLLDRSIFLAQLAALEQRHPAITQSTPPDPTWAEARHWAEQAQEFAAQIAQQEPSFIPDLLEALHTVLELATQVLEALTVIQQMRTLNFRQLAEARLQTSCDRLRETHSQLQYLQDQITLTALDRRTVGATPLPDRLRILITENKTLLNLPTDYSS